MKDRPEGNAGSIRYENRTKIHEQQPAYLSEEEIRSGCAWYGDEEAMMIHCKGCIDRKCF